MKAQRTYWDTIADDYQALTSISTDDFHFGPLLPGDKKLHILPQISDKTNALELGCGAGQNSIYLAKQGAQCHAIDISPEQIKHAKALAKQENLRIQFTAASLDEESAWPDASYDFIHSVYTLPFIEKPAQFIQRAATRLAKGGTFLLVTKHPLFSGEWLEIEDEELGLFIPSYFDPPEDIRMNKDNELISSRAYPVSTVAKWIYDAGLRDLRIWEPEPLPLDQVKQSPYHSPAWIELHEKLAAVPVSIIYSVSK